LFLKGRVSRVSSHGSLGHGFPPGLTAFYGSPVARLTGNCSSIAGFHVSGRRFVSGSPEFVNGGSGPHGFTNHPGSLSQVWWVAGHGLHGFHDRSSSRVMRSPKIGSHYFTSVIHRRIDLHLPQLSRSLPLTISRSLSRLVSLSLSISLPHSNRRTKKKR